MKTIIKSLTLVILFTFSARAENKLVIGVSADYPPFAYTKHGQIVGYDIDLINALANKVGFHFELKDMNFNNLMTALDQDMIDCVVAELTITEKRTKKVDFSVPYYTCKLAILCPENKAINSEQLQNKKIGVQLGSTMEIWAKKNTDKTTEIIAMDKNPNIIELMKAGQLDAVILENIQAVEFAKKNSGLQVIEIKGNHESDNYGIAFKKGSTLKHKIDTALQELSADGTIDKIKQKWIG